MGDANTCQQMTIDDQMGCLCQLHPSHCHRGLVAVRDLLTHGWSPKKQREKNSHELLPPMLFFSKK
jgi:hypothetical protein